MLPPRVVSQPVPLSTADASVKAATCEINEVRTINRIECAKSAIFRKCCNISIFEAVRERSQVRRETRNEWRDHAVRHAVRGVILFRGDKL